MKRLNSAALALLGLWGVMLAVSYIIGSGKVHAELVACTMSCFCKDVKGVAIIASTTTGNTTTSEFYYKVAADGTRSLTTHAYFGISSTGGCASGSPIETTLTIYKHGAVDWDPICLLPVPEEPTIQRVELVPPGGAPLFPPEALNGFLRKVCGTPP